MLRKWGSVLVAAVFVAASSSAFAAGAQQGALAPGQAAGVHKAQMEVGTLPLWVVGAVAVGAIGIGVGIAASSGNGVNSAVSTTTSCAPTGCTSTSTPSTTSTTSTTGT